MWKFDITYNKDTISKYFSNMKIKSDRKQIVGYLRHLLIIIFQLVLSA